MNKHHLWWIIPFCIVVGMLTYSLIDNNVEATFMPLVETCLQYEYDMDSAVILVQMHCLMDDISQQKNTLFCDEYMNQSKILSLYKFKT